MTPAWWKPPTTTDGRPQRPLDLLPQLVGKAPVTEGQHSRRNKSPDEDGGVIGVDRVLEPAQHRGIERAGDHGPGPDHEWVVLEGQRAQQEKRWKGHNLCGDRNYDPALMTTLILTIGKHGQ